MEREWRKGQKREMRKERTGRQNNRAEGNEGMELDSERERERKGG